MAEIRIRIGADTAPADNSLAGVNSKVRALGKSAAQVARETEKSANQTVGSYAKLRGELSSNKKALEQLEVGSDVFKEQAAVVAGLEDKLKAAKAEISAAVAAGQKFNNVAQAVAVTDGSLDQLRKSLKQATGELDQLKPGTAEFEKQGKVVAKLTADVNEARQSVDRFTQAGDAIGGVSRQVAVASNSVEGITIRLKQANDQLKRTDRGSDTYKKQAKEVEKLTKELDDANKEMKEFTGQRRGVDGVTGSLNRLEDELADNVRQLNKLKHGTAEFKKQKVAVDKLTRSVEEARQESKSLGDTGGKSLRGVEASAGNAGTAIKGALGFATGLAVVLERAGAAAREIRLDVADELTDVDTLARRLQIQGGLDDDGRREVGGEILSDARDQGVKKEVAFGVAEQSISSGFKNSIENNINDLFLKAIGATNFEGDGRELVKATSQFLKASGKEASKENTESLLVDVHSLFKGTDLQATDLGNFANAAPVLTGAGLEQKESLATLTALREAMTPEKAATSARNFIVNLEAADAKKSSREALESIGVAPKDVDFTGEGLADVLKTLTEGLKTVAPEQQNIALVKLFGKENLAASQSLIKSSDKIVEFIGLQGNTQQFYKDARTAANSKQATRNRIELQKSIEVFTRDSGEQAFQSDEARKRSDADYRRQQQDAVGDGSVEGAIESKRLEVEQYFRNGLVSAGLLDERDISKNARIRDIDAEISRIEREQGVNRARRARGHAVEPAEKSEATISRLRHERAAIEERLKREHAEELRLANKPSEHSTRQAVQAAAIPQGELSQSFHAVGVRNNEASAATVPPQPQPQPQPARENNEELLNELKRQGQQAARIAQKQDQRAEAQERLLEASLQESRKNKTMDVKNVDAGPVESPPPMAEAL